MRGGEWLVRIDDVDGPRTAAGATESILRCLEAHGLWWDGEVAYQQAELESYDAALDRLDRQGLLYRCGCSRKELATMGGGEGSMYPGRCAHGKHPPDRPHALRVRVGHQRVEFSDGLQGLYAQDLSLAVGDFVVRRRDRLYSYHLATVVDDAAAGIAEVVRGIDLLDSTPRQIYLQHCLGLPTPAYSHLPVVTDDGGTKLSKQNLAPAVNDRIAAANLVQLLRLLRQEPPAELAGTGVAEVLGWALVHWDLGRLRGCRTVTA